VYGGPVLEPAQILKPMVALAALTFGVLLLIPFVRFRAWFQGRVTPEDFKLGESPRVPPDVAIPNRNYMNLLELPTLFYAACLALLALEHVERIDVVIAWTYVGLRALHSLVHLTYNDVRHRLAAFATSNVVLSVLWIRLFLALD
jgi:hypothetical protein